VTTYQDRQFEALGDANRRALLSRLRNGPLPVVALARGLPISRPAVSQHLKVLKRARLVVDRPAGNRRLYELNPEALAALREYFDQFWSEALAAFKRRIESAEPSRVDDPDRS